MRCQWEEASFVITENGGTVEGGVSETRLRNFFASMNKSLILFSLSIARKAAAPAKKVVAKKVAKKVTKAAPKKVAAKKVAKKAAPKKVVAKKAAKKVTKKAAKK
jgi:hypothetical protein